MLDEPQLEFSELSQALSSAGKTVQVEIYRMKGEPDWMLEVIDEFNNSTVWDDLFTTAEDALSEVQQTIREEGVMSLIGPELTPRREFGLSER